MSLTRVTTSLPLALLVVFSGCTGEKAGPPAGVTVIVPTTRLAFQPRWSPDGTRIAYALVVEGKSAIWTSDADGSNAVRLTHGVWDSSPIWSPDGQWIAYEAEAPDYDVMLVSAAGGEPRALTGGPGLDVAYGWLRDGSGVVYGSQQGQQQTRVVLVADGTDRPLLSVEGDVEAHLSPDGAKVAYELSTGDGLTTIWVWDSAGAQHRQLTVEGREGLDPGYAWSPDSRTLLFRSTRTGSPDLWIADVATGELRQLTTDLRDDFDGRWSPDGQWVAFVSTRGGQQDVWIMPSAGGDAIRVTDDRALEFLPDWKPDGLELAFMVDSSLTQVHRAAVNGGETRLLSFSDYNALESRVSPDGKSVLFISDRSGNPDIWTAPLAGGDPRPVTTGALEDINASWAPDGRSIVFSSNRSGSFGIYVVPDSGGEARLVVDWPGTNEVTPRFSPDGSLIAFRSSRDARTTDIWVVPVAGGTPRRLTQLDASTTLSDWSRDGRHLMVRTGATSGAIYRVPVAGGSPLKLGTPAGADMAQWSPDLQRIAFADVAGGYSYVAVADSLGASAVRVTTSDLAYDVLPHWSPDGTRIAYEQFDIPNSQEDIILFNVADRSKSNVTATPDRSENHPHWTPDGQALVFQSIVRKYAIVSAKVGPLLERAAAIRR